MLCALLQWVPWLDNPRSWAHHAAGVQGRPNLSVFSAEQGKFVSLLYWGGEAVRRIDGDADSGTEKKRMLPCNRADRGCVAGRQRRVSSLERRVTAFPVRRLSGP
jgi:hypothetical protein